MSKTDDRYPFLTLFEPPEPDPSPIITKIGTDRTPCHTYEYKSHHF